MTSQTKQFLIFYFLSTSLISSSSRVEVQMPDASKASTCQEKDDINLLQKKIEVEENVHFARAPDSSNEVVFALQADQADEAKKDGAMSTFKKTQSKWPKCICPKDHPHCSPSYVDKGTGLCHVEYLGSPSVKLSCGNCDSSYIVRPAKDILQRSALGSKGWCYSYFGSTDDWCYTKNKYSQHATSNCASWDGHGKEWCCPSFGCAKPPGHESSRLKRSRLGTKGWCYSYFGNTDGWCYTKNRDGSHATSDCTAWDGYGKEWCCPSSGCSN